MILTHKIIELADGTILCKCRRPFRDERGHATHVAEMVIDGFSDVLQHERLEGQLSLLASAARYFGAGEPGAATRSRAVYTGAQFAGWCRERAASLSQHRSNGQGKPPTHDRSDSMP